MNALIPGIVGLMCGLGLSLWLERLSTFERGTMGWRPVSPTTRVVRSTVIVLLTAILFYALTWAEQTARVLDSPEIQPSKFGRDWRLYYHLVLISLLIMATAIDFDCYVIPDLITIPGMLIGLIGAFAAGEFQICHLWVDWTVSIPQLRGPDIPAWYDPHKHLHGLAWSSAGLVAGAILTWLARFVSSRVLGQEAMGFGDVTLMAMIGSFLGWQAVTLVFLLAPLAGLTVGVLIRLVSGKTYLPYGPWLSVAAICVLFRWGWLWEQTRSIFSDWLSLIVLAGIGSIGFVVLLGLTRLYRAIPVRSTASH